MGARCGHVSAKARSLGRIGNYPRPNARRKQPPARLFRHLRTRDEFEIGLERPFRHLILTLPSEWVDARVTRPDLLSGSVLRDDQPLAKLFAGYLAAGFQTAEHLSDSSVALLTRHLLELLAEAFAEPQSGKPAPSES